LTAIDDVEIIILLSKWQGGGGGDPKKLTLKSVDINVVE
jgi:hypothetical protein